MNFIIKFRETFFKKRETFAFAKRVFFGATALFCLNFQNFAQSCLENKAKITVKTVETQIDDIQEKGISLQIFEMAQNAFSRLSAKQSGFQYNININMSERSFYRDAGIARSLYTHYQLFSENGECVLENVFCSESKNSIISTLIQQKQIGKIAKDVKKFLASGQNNEA